jgi:hypothetical protein
MRDPYDTWGIPVDPDTDAAGDRGFGVDPIQPNDVPESESPDITSDEQGVQHEYDDPNITGRTNDPGDYVGTDFDQWRHLGYELPDIGGD